MIVLFEFVTALRYQIQHVVIQTGSIHEDCFGVFEFSETVVAERVEINCVRRLRVFRNASFG